MHNLDLTNGAPGMAYVGATPWHNLGVSMPAGSTLDDMIRAARLSWLVEKRPVNLDGAQDPGKRSFLVRTDNGALLDIVGPRFQVTQNAEALEFLRAFCDAGRATLETVGALDSGRYVWGLARLTGEWNAGTDERPDTMLDYLLVALPHMQAKAIICKYISTRVVCWNTYSTALLEAGQEFVLSHTIRFDERARQQAQFAMGLTRDASATMRAVAQGLARESLDDDQFRAFGIALVQADEDGARAILDGDVPNMPRLYRSIMDAYYSAPGAMPGTKWGAFNAVTYVLDHVRSAGNVNRLAKSGLVGTAASLKVRALSILTMHND